MGREYIGSANAWSHELSDRPLPAQQTWLTGNIKSLRTRLAKPSKLTRKEIMNRLFIPIVKSSHFFVHVVDFNPSSPDFFVNLAFYDSMRKSTRGSRGVLAAAAAAIVVAEVNDFFNNCVLYKREHTPWVHSNAELLKKVSYHECPSPLNDIDCCGWFCVYVVLHLLDGINVDSATFLTITAPV